MRTQPSRQHARGLTATGAANECAFAIPGTGAETCPVAREVDAALAEVQCMDIGDLRTRYRQITRKTAPAHLPKWLLQRIIAYRIQAKALGDLAPETVHLLDQIAREEKRAKATKNPEAAAHHRRIPLVPAPPPLARFKPGTVLVREHAGEMHRVTVLQAGYAWNGTTYRSLSEVARAITGTSWNGPRFFGLRDAKSRHPAAPTKQSKHLATRDVA